MKYLKIDENLFEKIVKNARINLTKEEKEKFIKQLEEILEAFKKIDEAQTSDLKPSFHPQEIKNVFRDDEVKKWEWNPLENTEHKEGKYFKGPRII